MIFSFLTKYIRTIIDALIIAAIVVAFIYFDPFKWFSPKVNIKNTPVSVESIKQIGQLITAEYYGETIASLPESYMESVDPRILDSMGQTLFIDINRALPKLKETDKPGWFTFDAVTERNIESRIEKFYPWIIRNKTYQPLMEYLCDTLLFRTTKKYEPNNVLWELYKKQSININRFKIDSTFKLKGFSNYLVNRLKLSFKEEKKNIVYIGRGWVKAGINFSILTDDDIYYNSSTRTLYIKDCEPEILDCDINPWFIPEKVKGFELIKQKGSFDNAFAEAVKVKKTCIEKLRLQAIKSGIIEQAKENARESLINLFSLLIDNEIRNIVFTKNKFDQLFNEIKKDKEISNEEAVWLDTLIRNNIYKLDTALYSDMRMQLYDLRVFCNKLKELQFADNPVNLISLKSAVYLKNDKIDSIEFEKAIIDLYNFDTVSINPQSGKIVDLICNYKLSKSECIDSCIAYGIIAKPKSSFKHSLSSFDGDYRDSLYTIYAVKAQKLMKKPEFEYMFWYERTEDMESDIKNSLRIITSHCDSLTIKSKVIERLKQNSKFDTAKLSELINSTMSGK